jgi:hypothetical protein
MTGDNDQSRFMMLWKKSSVIKIKEVLLWLRMTDCCMSNIFISGWAPVAHTCNPSYTGGRDQDAHSSKPAWVNSLQDPILKKTYHKKLLVEWLKVRS